MMEKKGLNLVKKGMLMTLLTWLVIGTACNDQLDNPKANPSNGKQVEVSLNIGFADEDNGISLSNSRSSNTAAGEKASTQKLAFDAQLISAVETRAGEAKPDQLYNLEIRQYDASGTCQNSDQTVIANQSIGSRLTISLTEMEDCQLVIVAWGTSIAKRLGTGTFSNACDVIIDQSAIKELDPTNADDMKKMPYYIYLPSVKVSANTITNPDGTDVRLLLKRLATRVTLNWKYTFTNDYNLKEVRLEGVPNDYRAIPFINTKDNTYPSLLDQYTTIIVPANTISNEGSYSCWIPATLRGTSNKATSAYYRNKENAPTGSVYATFVAQNNKVERKKLNYRLYLGSNTSDNFDLNPNTNYIYQINFAHKGLPTNDRRVSIIDPIPASEGNDFLSPTANCFMVAPGAAFCFNPYKYYVNGIKGENSLLQGWCATTKIKSVKVLWQTKENGDIGDPILGVVNSEDDHTNIVDLANCDDFNNARIYCRVAPNTSGGSGMIAAYDGENGTGNILWSWHIWVTDYTPDAKADVTVDNPKKRVQKYTYGGKIQNPIMDRNLGAMAGYTEIPPNNLEISKTNGFHYQWGRKDPFPSTYSKSATTTNSAYDITIYADKPTPGMLNYYQPDGISYYVRKGQNSKVSIRTSYQNPTTTYSSGDTWCSEVNNNLWDENGKKTFHDPCPAGWRIASRVNYQAFFTNTGYTESGTSINATVAMNIKNPSTIIADGGVVMYFENSTYGNSTYIRMTGYQAEFNKFVLIAGMCNFWCREYGRSNNHGYALAISTGRKNISSGWARRDAHPIRCIQER